MKINSFKALGVHDYLNFDITFYPDLTFLIGINGSGKTSALKLILGLTSPAFHYLNLINYQSCEVICSTTDSEKNIIIRADQTKTTFQIFLSISGQEFRTEPINRFLKKDDVPYDVEEIISMEQRHKEIFDNLEVTRRIRELATPKFLGLDRRIYEGSYIDTRFRKHRQFVPPKYRNRNFDGYPEPQAIDVSLEEVQSLIFDYTRRIPQQQYQINDEFKQKMFNQSFNFIDSYNVEAVAPSGSIKERKEKVLKAIEDLGIQRLDYFINQFFSKLEKVAKDYEELDPKEKKKEELSQKRIEIISKWYQNGPQLKRIDDIIKYSQEYQTKVAELRAPFKKLENLTANFLKEGRKILSIEADGEIKVRVKNAQSSNIYGLSSGEKQIIIMIAHLIFEEAQKTSGIFIIDEPELSLHIAWQEIFVQSIMEASPNTQFILATHSPSIIAKVDLEKHCQDLNKLNY
jgi:predicted ATP-dependent endonuclease of OLD family